MKFHILQKSISFLIPIILFTFYKKKYIYSIILLCNLLISLYVHRYNRKEIEYKLEDYIDLFFIFIWICKNIYELVNFIFTKNLYSELPKLIVILFNVYNCYKFNSLRKKYNFRSPKFNLFHMCMHFSGIFGTLCLIID